MLNYSEKDFQPIYGDMCHSEPPHPHDYIPHHPHHPHHRPPYTMTEDMELTLKLARDTIARLLSFEERVKCDINHLSKQLTSDNVIFKNAMHESWTTFLMEVKNEVNVFEGNVLADIQNFKTEVETNYANLQNDINVRIGELIESTKKQYDAFVDEINARLEQYNENHSQAFDLFQQNITTELNSFKATMTTNYNNFTENINTMIQEFKDSWTEIIDTRLDGQDAKISDAEMYMKTNLRGTVTDLISDMHANGDFTEILEGELFNDLENKTRHDFYTATKVDDIALCVAFCKLHDKVFYVPRGEVLEISETLDLTGVDVAINGTLKINHSGIGVIVGDKPSTKKREIVINEVVHEGFSNANGDVSVRVVGLMNGEVTIGNVPKVQLYADGNSVYNSIGYSTFKIGKCSYLEIVDNGDTTKVGWINENIFFVRVMEELSIKGNTYAHNNNVFYKPCLEGAKLLIKKAWRNKFYDVRTEGAFTYELDAETRQNFIETNFFFNNPTIMGMTNIDNGFGNIFVNHMLESLRCIPFYCMSAKTIEKQLFDVNEEVFSVSDDTVTPSKAWAKIITDDIISVKDIKYLMLRSEGTAFRLYVTPLNENKEVVTNGLGYAGATQKSNGQYETGANTGFAVVEITDPNVKYVKLSVSTGSTIVSFKNMTLIAYFDPQRFNNAYSLAERYRK